MKRAACLLSLSLVGLVWSGCSKKEATEYVAGVSTQVKVPRDLKAVRLSVSIGGVRTFCRAYRAYDGKVLLPKSLGSYALNDPAQSGPITFQIIGLSDALAEGDELDDLACGDKVGGDNKSVRILRRSRQPYVPDEILFLPMPLKYSCFDKDCPDEQTCKGNVCVDALNTLKLPKFRDDLVDGSGADCFSITQCLAAALPALPVTLDDCTFAVAGTKDAPPPLPGVPNPFAGAPTGDGVNVEVTYDGGYVTEVLDKDPDEGFSIPDPNHPQQFRLAPGLCALYKGGEKSGKRITAVRASATCRPKVITQTICQDDQLAAMGVDKDGLSPASTVPDGCKTFELLPPKTALAVVIDDTQEHHKFFDDDPNAIINGQSKIKFAVSLAFADPAFNRADFTLLYTSGPLAPTCAAPTDTTPAIPLESARTAAPKISTSIDAHKTMLAASSEPRYEEGLKRAYDAISANPDYFARAVIVIGERWANSCGGVGDKATDRASAAKLSASKIQTYTFDFASADNDTQAQIDASALAVAGGSPDNYADARKDALAAKETFQKVVDQLATCAYDNEPSLKDGVDKLGYNNPVSGQFVGIDAAPVGSCPTGQESVNGWGRSPDGKHIFLCGKACTDYRQTLRDASLITNAYGKPNPAMPMFGWAAACAPALKK